MSDPKDTPELTAAQLRELLDYDPETGVFRWRVTNSNRAVAGKEAGCIETRRNTRYRTIPLRGRRYYAQRLAWLYMTGEWPEHIVDHRDGEGLNNRWENLRQATEAQNARNARRHRDNTTGLKGVHFNRQLGRFQANIHADGVSHHLGLFDTAEEAGEAYANAAQRLHGPFARHD